MCGRITRTSPAEVIVEQFGVLSGAGVDLRARYNLCPGESVTVLIEHGGDRRLGSLRWGLPPRSQINVRSESVARRATVREALRRRRCVVLADGFFEWRTVGSARLPHFFHLESGLPFGLAAIWQRVPDAGGPPGAAILTCAANALVATVHDRMPVILDPENCRRWLDRSADMAALEALLRPFPCEPMEAYPVSKLVNSARNDSPDCIRPTDGTLRLVPRSP